MNIKWTANILPKIVLQNNCRHAGRVKEQVHHHQNWCHIHQKCQLCHLVPMRELKVPKSKMCHPDMSKYILLFSMLNFWILMHMPKIASKIQIMFQICLRMKKHQLVSTLSRVSECSCNPFYRSEHPIDWSWQGRQTSIEWNRIFEYY